MNTPGFDPALERAVSAWLVAAGLDRELPELRFTPTPVQLFRFSAVTWNAHRIHVDPEYARGESHEGIVVHSTLRGAQLMAVLASWLGRLGSVESFSWRNLRPAHAGETVTCSGVVTHLSGVTERVVIVDVQLAERSADGELGATGKARVRFGSEDHELTSAPQQSHTSPARGSVRTTNRSAIA